MNISDAERIQTVLNNLGYEKTSRESEADLIMVVACSVRQKAIDRVLGKSIQWQKRRSNGQLITVLTGCILDEDIKKFEERFDIIFEIKDLAKLPRQLSSSSTYKFTDYLKLHPTYNSGFQAYVPIMTGCNNFCSYCVVPYTRGREISRPVNEILKECNELVGKGYKEIILLGQNVNSYSGKLSRGKWRSKKRQKKIEFSELLRMVDAIEGNFWLSFATSHPKDMSDRLVNAMAQGRHVIPYLHLPIQSGDDRILKAMNRHYTVSHYKRLIKKVRKAVLGITVTTDIIVGFPGETREQFNNTVKLFKEIRFDMAYIAQYSRRAGTAAAKLGDNISQAEKKARDKKLNLILKKTALERNEKMIGQTIEVLVEKYQGGFCFGRTLNFKNIKFASGLDRTGELVLVKIIGCYEWGLAGELPRVVVVLGTTASGKTSLAVKFAKKFGGEIISADSTQVYKGMDIGTGKDLNEYQLASGKQQAASVKIPYHLIDIVNPNDKFSVADWKIQAESAIRNILKRGKLPIVCGGTALYINALIEGYEFGKKSKAPKIKKSKLNLNKLPLKRLLSELKKVDPETYEIIDKNNRRRVQRALEIFYESGIKKSDQQIKTPPAYDFFLLGLTFPRPALNARIDKRLLERIEKEGMIKEVKRLHNKGVNWKRLEEFGLEYRFVSRYLRDKISCEEMVEQLKNAIHHFAKRQMTWFKRNKDIVWIKNYSEADKKLRKFIK